MSSQQPADAPRLHATGVTVRFGALTAVDELDCAVGDADILGLIGPNGAGKSTLVDAISGLVPTALGTVSLEGHDLTSATPHRRFRRGLGRTFQKVSVVDELTVREFAVVAEMQGNYLKNMFHWHTLSERSEQILGVFDLQGDLDRQLGSLSYMHKRLMAIASSLMGGVTVSMLDEATAGLSAAERHKVGTILKDLVTTLGVSFIVIEHDLEFVATVANTVLAMDQGRSLAYGDPDEVLSDPDVVRAYVGT